MSASLDNISYFLGAHVGDKLLLLLFFTDRIMELCQVATISQQAPLQESTLLLARSHAPPQGHLTNIKVMPRIELNVKKNKTKVKLCSIVNCTESDLTRSAFQFKFALAIIGPSSNEFANVRVRTTPQP